MRLFFLVLSIGVTAAQSMVAAEASWVPRDFHFFNVAAPVFPARGEFTPVTASPFIEHVRRKATARGDYADATGMRIENGSVMLISGAREEQDGHPVTARATQGALDWIGTPAGLYVQSGAKREQYPSYGVDGPLATAITGLAVDSRGALWVGTPLGLSCRDGDGTWSHVQGRHGLPVETITALAVNEFDHLWIGTRRGAVLYKPYETGRQWFYRAGKRYLPNDYVRAIAIAEGGATVYFLTEAGVSSIELKTTTLLEKAKIIEERVNKYHRRMGLVADCIFDSAESDEIHRIPDRDNDGLWTAYHVAAMSLCYGATGDSAAKVSAREGMHALYMLQNASGTPGLVARSVLPAEIGRTKGEQWRPTPDGTMYWKSDTSSDEIDGHYLAFYTYFEHIARHEPDERKIVEKQVRALTDYLVDNNYQLIDWDGKRTRWGFWNPEALNKNPMDYVEAGLNSLQILSFLRVAHYITGDERYEHHFRKLALKHQYLNNILLVKKCFPDENNHSDDQLGFVAWYPILQLEKDPRVRKALLAGVHRHYLVVKPEKPSFYTFVYATVNPLGADIEAAVENLKEIPTDRRVYGVKNSIRADVRLSERPNRFGQPVITRVLPADERCFKKWNADPYRPDEEGDGTVEDDGAAYLLPYWMARFHGLIREAG